MNKLFIVTDIMSVSYSDIQALYPLMPEDRQRRCCSYRQETDRRLSILSYALLLYSLHSECGAVKADLAYGPHGKPFLVDQPQIHFNLSHCNQGIALALSSEPVGVDIESFDRYDESLIDATMSEEESALVRNSQTPAQAFIQLWTEKESFVKYTGKGIENNMKDILEMQNGAHIKTFVDCSLGCAISVCGGSEPGDGFIPRYMSAEELCRNLLAELPLYENK